AINMAATSQNATDWMSALPAELWDVPLTNLAIPGKCNTHFLSRCYCLDINSPLVPSESDFFRLLDRLFSCFTRPAIFRWATTQVCCDRGLCQSG
uniref:Si:dkey-66a8.7 n=1 Tax=Sander lucioperca TaxID=283035 RepID=A0A8C9YUJ8_SANLU